MKLADFYPLIVRSNGVPENCLNISNRYNVIVWYNDFLCVDVLSFETAIIFLRQSTLNLPRFCEKKSLGNCVCPKSYKLTVVRPNTESVFSQFRNSEILDYDWHL